MPWHERLQDALFVVLIAALFIAALRLGQEHGGSWDLSRDQRYGLSPGAAQLVAQFEQPVVLTLYAGNDPALSRRARDLVDRFTRANPLLRFESVNIERDPSISRELSIARGGELIIRHDGNEARAAQLSAAAISDALSQLLLAGERTLLFLEGAGQRRAEGQANHDLGLFTERLRRAGYRVQRAPAGAALPPPAPGTVLVVASPTRPLAAADTAQLRQWLDGGGALLWLQDDAAGAQSLTALLPIRPLPGVIVDEAAAAAGLPRPDFGLTEHYPAALAGMAGTSLFPRPLALRSDTQRDWRVAPLLQSSSRAWNETGEIDGAIQPDADGERTGPLDFGLSLERNRGAGPQRVAVIGDGDFLANAWLGNGNNAALGEALVAMLSDTAGALPAPLGGGSERQVQIAPRPLLAVATLMLAALPLFSFSLAAWQWRRQRA